MVQGDTSLDTDAVALSTVPSARAVNIKKFRDEIWKQMRLAAPTILGYVGTMMLGVETLLFVGHLGADSLAAAALANMYANVTGFSIAIGLLSAMDTLCSQAYGAEKFESLAHCLQRAITICTLLAIPISILWWFTEDLLLLARQDPAIAHLSGGYVRVLIVGLWPFYIFEAVKRWLQAQGIVTPITAVCLGVNGLNLLYNAVFVYWFKWGLFGSAFSMALSYWSLLLLLALVIVVKRRSNPVWPNNTWQPWSVKSAFSQWKPFFALGIPGMFQTCLEWWSFEVLALLAGILGTLQLAAHSVVLNTLSLAFMFPLGISIAANTRVGNSLGADRPGQASFASLVALVFCLCSALCICVLLISVRHVWGRIYSSDPEVVALVASIVPILALLHIVDALQGVAGGILRGCGRQTLGAVLNFFGYWVLGIPCGILLTWHANLGLKGLWWGQVIAQVVMVSSEAVVLLRSDWAKYAQDAKRRAEGTLAAQFTVLSSADGFDDDDDDIIGREHELSPMTNATTTTTTTTATTNGKKGGNPGTRKLTHDMAERSKLQGAQPHVQWSNDGMYTIETVDSDSASSGHTGHSHSSVVIR